MSLRPEDREDDSSELHERGSLALLPPRNSPRLKRRRLGNELRRLREAAGVSVDQVASSLYCSRSKISRIERGQVSATVRDVRDIIDLCRVNPTQREVLLRLALEARQKAWWHAYKGIPTLKAYVSYEAAAAGLQVFDAMVVPGLFQVPEYARAVISGLSPSLSADEIEHRLSFRIARQSLLTSDDPPECRAILDEAVLHRFVGSSSAMRKQLSHLIDSSSLSNIRLRVLPFNASRLISITGGFTILSFYSPDDPRVVYIEHTTGDLYFDEPLETLRHAQIFSDLERSALSPKESVALVQRILGTL